MANFDNEYITVYQAYRAEIGHFAVQHQQFGGAFSYSRMSWIKPNFLWMMYRSGWARKEGQEVILAITITRLFFDEILTQAVPSSYCSRQFASQEKWKAAIARSDVRLQWDPDHSPDGGKQERRAIQLGLRGEILSRFGRNEAIEIRDISDFVRDQSKNLDTLLMPRETPYYPELAQARESVSLDKS